jgi:hypothetical protein
LEYYRAEGVLVAGDGDAVNPEHALLRSTAGLLDSFCEAYWTTARTLAQLDDGGMPQKALLETVRKRYATGLLLGDVRRPEGNSTVTLGNALSRFTETGFIVASAGLKGRERLIRRGPHFAELRHVERRLAANLQQP